MRACDGGVGLGWISTSSSEEGGALGGGWVRTWSRCHNSHDGFSKRTSPQNSPSTMPTDPVPAPSVAAADVGHVALRTTDAFISPVRSRSEPGSFISSLKPSRTLRHILRRQASLPKTRELASFPHSRVHSCFRHGLLPGPPGSGHPPKWSVASPRNPPRRSTNSTLPFCARVDFVQDSLYPNELKVYKPASKVVPTSPRLHPSSTLKSSFTTRLSV
jgi:hypothetical protein